MNHDPGKIELSPATKELSRSASAARMRRHRTRRKNRLRCVMVELREREIDTLIRRADCRPETGPTTLRYERPYTASSMVTCGDAERCSRGASGGVSLPWRQVRRALFRSRRKRSKSNPWYPSRECRERAGIRDYLYPFCANCVEKLRLIEAPCADLLSGAGDSVDDGRTADDAGGAVLRLQPRAACP